MWRFQFLGGMKAFRPDGSPVVFPTRKTAGLLVILVMARGRVRSRDELGEALWPEVTEEGQRTNLRKAVSMLRRALGPTEALRIERETMRWEPEGSECDAWEDGVTGVFCPEMPEPWFEDRRSDFLAPDGRGDDPEILGFLETLLWTLQVRPERVVGMLRAAPELATCLPPGQLRHVSHAALRAMPESDPLRGWGLYFHAFGLLASHRLELAAREAERARAFGEAVGDVELMAESLYVMGAQSIIGNELDRAERIGRVLESLGEAKSHVVAQGRARHLLALTAFHRGEDALGMSLLAKAKQEPLFMGNELEMAHVVSHHALFSATAGDWDAAARSVEEAERALGRYPNWRLRMCCRLVKGMLLLADKDAGAARKEFRGLVEDATWNENYQLAVYGLESEAVAARMEEDREGVRAVLERALGRRRDLQMRFTPWDSRRLEKVAVVRPD